MSFKMGMVIRIFIILYLVFTLVSNAFAIPEGLKCKIIGRVIDSASKRAIDYAAVSVYKNGTTEAAGGMITDDKGQFLIENLERGTYKLKIDYIGYKTKTIEGIVLKPGENNYGDIIIADKSRTMKEVTVTGTKSYVENKIDKLVFNVGNDVTSAGGNATDVLKKVPQVSVDIDGNVELLGNSNIKVLLNGKPSAQFDNNLAEALRVIPASQIEKIEVITSPGAQYDAEGTGGIINIILKESKIQGVNGTVSLSSGTFMNNGSLYLHAQKNKVELNFSMSGNMWGPAVGYNTLNRKSDSGSILQTQLLQNGSGNMNRKGYRGQLGLEWDVSKKDHISVSFGYFFWGHYSTGVTNQQQISLLPIIDTFSTLRNTVNNSISTDYDFSLNYKKSFAKDGHEFLFSFRPSYSIENSFFNQNQQLEINNTALSGAKGNNNVYEYETYITADYNYPFGKDATFNTGAKGQLTKLNSNTDHYALQIASGDFVLDPYLVDNYNYNRDVYSYYASVSFPVKEKFSFKIGVRDEVTMFHKILAKDSTIPSYNTIAPSAVISRNITKTQTLKISYAYRIQRPGPWNLNPFIDATDPLNIQQGNPGLVPEKVQNIDLSYFHSFEKGSSFLVMLYYRYSTDDEQSYVYFKPTIQIGDSIYKNVSINTNVNAGTQYVSGINVSGTLKAFDEKLEMRGNFYLFNKYIVSQLVAGATSNSLNYRTNFNVSFKFTKTLVAECYANFRSASTEIQGKFPSWSSYSMAIKKMFWDKSGSLALTANNPFTPYVIQTTDIAGQNFAMQSERKIPFRSFGLSFTYKFGKMQYNEGRQDGGEMDGKEGMN